MEGKLITVSTNNFKLIGEFVTNLGRSRDTFRYFDKRDFNVFKNHIITYLYIKDNKPVGYGHLDKDDDTVWLGVAVLPGYYKMGIGNLIVQELLKVARKEQLNEVFLTVDNYNKKAIELYNKVGFKVVENFNSSKISKFKLDLN